jgi:Holliday junction DNA helicase RuvA
MIATSNETALNSIKGIGIKTAQRIIIDLKDKILKIEGIETASFAPALGSASKDEAVSALVMLGFPQALSVKTVEKIIKDDPSLKVEQLIKMALKMM